MNINIQIIYVYEDPLCQINDGKERKKVWVFVGLRERLECLWEREREREMGKRDGQIDGWMD